MGLTEIDRAATLRFVQENFLFFNKTLNNSKLEVSLSPSKRKEIGFDNGLGDPILYCWNKISAPEFRSRIMRMRNYLTDWKNDEGATCIHPVTFKNVMFMIGRVFGFFVNQFESWEIGNRWILSGEGVQPISD